MCYLLSNHDMVDIKHGYWDNKAIATALDPHKDFPIANWSICLLIV